MNLRLANGFILSLVLVSLVLFAVIILPMRAETRKALAALESRSADGGDPEVPVEAAAYVDAPADALSDFFAVTDGHLQISGLVVESRQTRIDSNPRSPVASLIYETRIRGTWPQVTSFLSTVRSASPRIQIQKLILRRLDKPQHVEAILEARSLAIRGPG